MGGPLRRRRGCCRRHSPLPINTPPPAPPYARAQVVSSSYAAAAYLSSVGFAGTALLLGPQGVAEELSLLGIAHIDSSTLALSRCDTLEAIAALRVDPAITAVVVGWDAGFSYSKIVYASICLRELPGCETLVATNLDDADNIGGGRMMPGTGGLVAAVASASGVAPINVGKGGSWLLPFLCATYNLQPSRCAVRSSRGRSARCLAAAAAQGSPRLLFFWHPLQLPSTPSIPPPPPGKPRRSWGTGSTRTLRWARRAAC